MATLTISRCKSEEEAVKVVLDRYYSGQHSFFEKILARSVRTLIDNQKCWEVTVYIGDIFKETRMRTYLVDEKKQVTLISYLGL